MLFWNKIVAFVSKEIWVKKYLASLLLLLNDFSVIKSNVKLLMFPMGTFYNKVMEELSSGLTISQGVL